MGRAICIGGGVGGVFVDNCWSSVRSLDSGSATARSTGGPCMRTGSTFGLNTKKAAAMRARITTTIAV